MLELLDMCQKPKCNYQKQITLNRKHFEGEGAGFKNKIQNFLKEPKQLGVNS